MEEMKAFLGQIFAKHDGKRSRGQLENLISAAVCCSSVHTIAPALWFFVISVDIVRHPASNSI